MIYTSSVVHKNEKGRNIMDSIVAKLLEIETTAEAIVANAEAQKPVIEKEIIAKMIGN